MKKRYDVCLCDAKGELLQACEGLTLKEARDVAEMWFRVCMLAHEFDGEGTWRAGFDQGEVDFQPTDVEVIAVYDIAKDAIAWTIPVAEAARQGAAWAAEQGPAGRLRTPLRAGEGTPGGIGTTIIAGEIRRAFRYH